LCEEDSGFGAFVVVQEGEQGSVNAGEGVVAETGGFAFAGMDEALAFAVEDEFGVVDECHAVSLGKLLGAVTDKVDMVALFEDQAGGLNGITKALDAGYASSLHAAAVHEESIKLYAAVGGEKAAAACVEGRVIFEDSDGGFNGIEGGCTARKKGVAGFKSLADTVQVVGSGVGGNGPCATVNDKSWGVESRGGHRVMVEHLATGLHGRVVPGKIIKNCRDKRL
jgi:hypothetical protein